MSDSARRGVLESSQGTVGWWAVRFADTSRNIRATDLELLPADASFEPSQAPPGKMERQRERQLAASAAESANRGLSVAASNNCTKCPIALITGKLGPEFAS